MNASEAPRDLIVLVPGKDDRAAIQGILAKPRALGIRPVTAEFRQHPDRDAGCRLCSPEFLRHETSRFAHALVVFDREGCGAEDQSREQLEQDVERQLSASGWGDRAAVVVIDPELEAWVWNDTPHVDDALGWAGQKPSLRDWLIAKGFLAQNAIKPQRPKEAVEKALRVVAKRRSSAIYAELAEKVSLARCVDPAFIRLRQVLQKWFPADREVTDGP